MKSLIAPVADRSLTSRDRRTGGRLVPLMSTILAMTACSRSPAPTLALVGGFHAGSPARLSVAVGPALVLRTDSVTLGDSLHRRSFRRDRDIFALAEPGWKGARLSLGYGTEWKSRQLGGIVSVRGTMYRRWASDTRDPRGTYAGVELSAGGTGEALGAIRMGFLSRVAGPVGKRGTLFTIDYPVGW